MSLGDEIEKLADLHRRGALSDAEFAQAKARLIGASGAGGGAGADPATLAAINGLRRSRSERWFGGVCGGLAQVSGIAVWLWRLAFVLFVLCAGVGGLVYLLLWLVLPLEAPPPAYPTAAPVPG